METNNYFKASLWYCYRISFLVILFIIASLGIAECQNTKMPESTFKGGSYEQTFSTGRLGLAQTVMNVPKAEFHLVINHRFDEISSGVNNFFGIDFALTRIGLDYGVFNWLSATFGRNLSVKSYEFALKAVMLKQSASDMPVSLSWYGSALEDTQLYTENGNEIFYSFGNRLSFVNQLNISRNQGILSFQASPMWLHVNNDKQTSGPLDIFAVDLGSRVRLTEMLGIFAEYIPVLSNTDFPQSNLFTMGLDINTGKHQFQVFLTNSQGTDEKTLLTRSEGTWAKGNIYLGFNLTRVFNSKTD